ncbi:VOC family protein [Alginatibacterium sediminis]|uniref:VOC family protein n=1 Tax=Alginatibacterium sediminis TaxID=2164068 RepID=A0A420EGN4_9ALTE|nr:VOC family protein [Alginatibacterium sediminis]RKF19716.1 VOC family protein [Alginatibacterium sediminis]
MNLGKSSISLSVKNLQASFDFYQKFGYSVVGGNADEKWLVLKNGEHIIGIFEGMFEKNMLTFNPGWDQNGQQVDGHTDVRELQRQLKSQGVKIESEADENSTGPASFIAIDPDGNPILIDQHF